MDNNERECPYCGQVIKVVAKKCWHCKHWLDGNQPPVHMTPFIETADIPTPIEDSIVTQKDQESMVQSLIENESTNSDSEWLCGEEYKNYKSGILAGFIMLLLTSSIWAIVVWFWGDTVDWLGICVGLGVGFGVGYFSHYPSKTTGMIGAFMSLLACMWGNYLCACIDWALENDLGVFTVVNASWSNFFSLAFPTIDKTSMMFLLGTMIIGFFVAKADYSKDNSIEAELEEYEEDKDLEIAPGVFKTLHYKSHKAKWWQNIMMGSFFVTKAKTLDEFHYEDGIVTFKMKNGKVMSGRLEELKVRWADDSNDRMSYTIYKGEDKVYFHTMWYMFSVKQCANMDKIIKAAGDVEQANWNKIINSITSILEAFK